MFDRFDLKFADISQQFADTGEEITEITETAQIMQKQMDAKGSQKEMREIWDQL